MAGVDVLRDFPRTFWIANLMELFERAAYYGLNSVLGAYLVTSIARGGPGFSKEDAGLLQGIVYAATYIVPILGGALADRYGYRRMLLVAFSLLAAGYFAAGYQSTYALVFLALLVMATGSGLFKPIISGTVARTTDERTSPVGFGIYYWTINVGAFLTPFVVSVLKGFSWQAVFTASAVYCAAMLLPAAVLFHEPRRPESTKRLRDVLAGAAEVLGDARFMLMIVVYSGFWILYFQNFGTVLWYLQAFIDRAPVSAAVTSALHAVGLPWTFTFDVEHVTAINAGTIILLQVAVSKLVARRPALPTMVTGMLIGAGGFVLLATSFDPWVFIAGIAVFSIGEMTTHPRYYSFVGLVAPEDRKALYMGYAFLYGVFGSLLGANVGAFLYTRMLEPVVGTAAAGTRTAWFWLIFAALDVVAAMGLLLFARRFGEDTATTRSRARRVMVVVYTLIGVLGLAFLYGALRTPQVEYGTIVRAGIFIALAAVGLRMNRRRAERPET